MKRVFSYLVGFGVLCFSFQALAIEFPEIQPYVGIDAQWRHMDFKPGLGKKLFKENVPQGNIYAGIQFWDYLGLEGGYESTKKKIRAVSLAPGETGLGFVIAPLDTEGHVFESKLQGWHLSLIGFTPWLLENQCTRFFGGIGLSNKRIKLVDNLISVNGIIGSASVLADARINLEKRKSFLRLSGGVQYMLSDMFGVRGSVIWENTQKFKNLKPSETSTVTASLKNNITLGLGVFAKF